MEFDDDKENESLSVDEREFIDSGIQCEYEENFIGNGGNQRRRSVVVDRTRKTFNTAAVFFDKNYRRIVSRNYFTQLVRTEKNGLIFLTDRGKEFVRHLKVVAVEMVSEIPPLAMSPILRVVASEAREIAQSLFFTLSRSSINEYVQLLMEYIGRVKSLLLEKGFMTARNNFRRLYRKNRKSLALRLAQVPRAARRINAIRLDLFYDVQCRKWVSKKDILTDFGCLLLEIGRRLKYIYWARKLEYGVTKKFHIHLLLILDADKHFRGITIAERLGQFWRETATKGRGRYWNCNKQEKRYQHRGIGLMRTDSVEFENLQTHAAPYLIKSDYYFKALAGGRSFTQSKVRGPEHSSVTGVDEEAAPMPIPMPSPLSVLEFSQGDRDE